MSAPEGRHDDRAQRFTDAYASSVVAVYEPMIVRWVSRTRLWSLADMLTRRSGRSSQARLQGMTAAPLAMRSRNLPVNPSEVLAAAGITPEKVLKAGGFREALNTLPAAKRRQVEALVPHPELLDGLLAGRDGPPGGWGAPRPSRGPVPLVVSNGGDGGARDDFDIKDVRSAILTDLATVAAKIADEVIPAADLREHVLSIAGKHLGSVGTKPGLDLLPVTEDVVEMLSPIGVAHFYRQLYFSTGEGVGPIEQAFTVAPAETLEVVYENVRRQIHEETIEVGSEVVSESAVEEKNLSEVSDKVSSMIQRDTSAAMTSNVTGTVSGGVGVWSASASASTGASGALSTSAQRSSELASRNVKETTRRAAERITKSVRVTTRDVLDITATNVTRRVIKNDSDRPVSYGLRRVFNRIDVKVQSLGPRLVWQLYLRNPGAGLARSSFVHFLESGPIADALAPPATRPRPVGGNDTGTTTTSLAWDPLRGYYVVLVIRTGSDRTITAVSIDSITDLEGGGKEDYAPSPRNHEQWDAGWDDPTRTFSAKIPVLPGDASSVQIGYSYTWEPGESALVAWESEVEAAQAAFAADSAVARQKALEAQFDRERTLITERSRIRPRPANDLRREERYEVMNRLVSHVFAREADAPAPGPLDIELVHRYFDLEALFVYTHPSWWKPRFSPVRTGVMRPAYQITAESDPAPMGSSLGWLLQLDGDTRRNEFINSPWVRVCLPIRPDREREAIAWLARHIEGEIGYKPEAEPLKGLLSDIETVRGRERSLGKDGPEYVTVTSTVGAPGSTLTPENVFPVVDEFTVSVPSEGFVYDALVVTIP